MYFWEILDAHGLRVHSYAFWRTFPAAGQNGGVLSERWRPTLDRAPYASGLAPAAPPEPLPLVLPEVLAGPAAREQQTWGQLYQRAASNDFDLCIAYFPLADLLDEPGSPESRRAFTAYRERMIGGLLEALSENTRVGILIASGKTAVPGDKISLDIISNWISEMARPFTNHLQLAPMMLEVYGLPRDRMMPESTLNHPAGQALGAIDYGEPHPDRRGDPHADARYYEELKSLGYIR